MTRASWCGAFAALFIMGVGLGEAAAGGFTFPENTTKGVGRGGAYMLGATGPEVIYLNPALLTRLDVYMEGRQ